MTTASNFRRKLDVGLAHFYNLKVGGTSDTVAALSVGCGLLATSPALSGQLASFPYSLLPIACTMAGGAWLAWRAMEPWRREHALASSLKIRSDESPLEPDHNPGATTGGLLVGYTTDSGKPIYIDDEHLMRHLFIIGQSGVGKTVAASLLMFQQIQRGGGLLFIDGKIDAANLAQIYHYCCYTGRQHDFLVINPDDPDNSNTYNPVLFGDADEKADGILQLIPSTETNPGADFFKQEAKQALTTLIRALQRARLAYNVIDLTVLLMNGNAMLELERKLATAAPNSAELKEFTLFLDKFRVQPSPQNPSGGIDMKKLKDVFGGIGGRLYSFGTGKFGQIMNTYDPEVNLYEAIRGNKIIYCALPTMGKDTTARNFGRMVIADLRTAISWLQKLPEKERPWPPFMAFCDEAGSYLNENWSRIPEQSRSAHVFFVPAVQTVANFQAISDELYEMVIGNAWTKLIFKVGTQGTAEEAAELIGKKIGVLRTLAGTTAESSSMSMLRHLPDSNLGAGASMASGEREQEMYIITPDELKGLQKGEAVMTYGGDQIFNIRIPMTKFDKEAQARFGEFRVNRFRAQGLTIDGVHWRPAGFFANVDRYLSTAAVRKETAKAHEEDQKALNAEQAKVAELQKAQGDAEAAAPGTAPSTAPSSAASTAPSTAPSTTSSTKPGGFTPDTAAINNRKQKNS